MTVPDTYVLLGRVVTMDANFTVLPDGAVYVRGNTILAVQKSSEAAPAGFESATRVTTGGTLYPGLIELHNHISYNPLTLWNVPRKFQHRGQWANSVEKQKLISGPMGILAKAAGYVEAIVRFVECKCLLAGVTTTQGVTLQPAPTIDKKYRGIVRNVELTADPTQLPIAAHRIADVEADGASAFLKLLDAENSCFLLHLSEGVTIPGVTDVARQHFLSLKLTDKNWAITPVLAGIHSAGLLPEDFAILASKQGSMVWSPLSNLLLYGDTANVAAAHTAGVRIALGSDWSPSGSKNLLGELKIARIYSQLHGGLFSDEQLAAMVTIEPARMLKWDHALGSLEPGKRADILTIDSQAGAAYDPLMLAGEAAVGLVLIDGVPRYGLKPLMDTLGVSGEAWNLGGRARVLNLVDADTDPIVGKLTLTEARDRLKQGFSKLPTPTPLPAPEGAAQIGAEPGFLRLVLDNEGPQGRAQRALSPLTTAEVIAGFWAASTPVPVEPVPLDELTVAEDPSTYMNRLRAEMNLPSDYKDGLPKLYAL